MKKLIYAVFVALWSDGAIGSDTQFEKIIEAEWQYQLLENPIRATRVGVNNYNHTLPDISMGKLEARYNQNRAFLAQLHEIEKTSLSQSNQVNYDLLVWLLEERKREFELGTYRVPINTFSSFFSQATRALTDAPLNSKEDYDNYIQRINALPLFFKQNIAHMRVGLKGGFTQPKIIIDGIIPVVDAQIYANPEDSPLYRAFLRFPSTISENDKRTFTKRGRKAIEESANKAFTLLSDFLKEEYQPNTRKSVGAYQMQNGVAYYAHQIQRYVTATDKSAEQIHQIGLSEVKRIKSEMLTLIQELEFEGTFDEFVHFLRTDPQFYAKTADDLLKEASYIAKRIDIKMPGYFGKLPRLPYGIEPVPAAIAPNYTTAAYWGSPFGSPRGGAYVVNTYALDQRPLYELTALTLHEAVPGHHHQNALSRELQNVPQFRRSLYLSAFGEGWGLYSEKLGVEMGVYRNGYEHFGRLSYEMWRACRLVIDTGIHALGWSRQQGLDFLADNTSLSLQNVRAEVDRYISWPGQALSYKLGEIKIWELRGKTEKALGEQFDIKAFHDTILENGAIPLVRLEAQIDQYIREKTSD